MIIRDFSICSTMANYSFKFSVGTLLIQFILFPRKFQFDQIVLESRQSAQIFPLHFWHRNSERLLYGLDGHINEIPLCNCCLLHDAFHCTYLFVCVYLTVVAVVQYNQLVKISTSLY
jgi:hypothetical protein